MFVKYHFILWKHCLLNYIVQLSEQIIIYSLTKLHFIVCSLLNSYFEWVDDPKIQLIVYWIFSLFAIQVEHFLYNFSARITKYI